MKRNLLRVSVPVLLLVSLFMSSGCVSTRRFQTGFHMGLGMMAAQAAVGTVVGLVGGLAGGGRSSDGYRNGRTFVGASPYEAAYAREAARLERKRHQRWVRSERDRGRRDALADYGYQ